MVLSCDASPQNGVDFQMTLEDMVERDRCLTTSLLLMCAFQPNNVLLKFENRSILILRL